MPKGVSAQEKRDRMLAIFHRPPVSVFTQKEIEKESSKAGIVSGAIEGVLKELVGDNLVREEKISGSRFYWSFPGEQRTRKQAEIAQVQAAAAQLSRKATELTAQADEARKATGQSEADASRIREAEEAIATFKKRESDARTARDQLLKASGQNLGLRKKDLPVLRDAANRWTDNLFELRKYLVNKYGQEEAAMDKRLGTDKIDYIE